MKNNTWLHGKTKFVYPKQIVNIFGSAGIYFQHLILDQLVGEEVVLIIYDNTDFIYELATVSPFVFNYRALAIKTSQGAIGVFLFYVEHPSDSNSAYVIFDKPVDITNQAMLDPWLELNTQTKIHLILLDKNLETAGFFEFENFGKFDDDIEMFNELKSDAINFEKAKEEYFAKYNLEELFKMSQKNTDE